MTSPDTRLSLIARLHDAQDVQAWGEFVQIYQPLIFRVAAQRGLQYADAVEVTQEVLARVHRNVASWDPDRARGSFRGWLYRITRNLTIDFLRRRNAAPGADRPGEYLPVEELADPSPQESQAFYLEYERQLFHWAAGQVKPGFQARTWQAFWLTAVDGRPVAEVATELQLTPGAVYVARCRVIQKLSQTIQSRLDDSMGA